MEIDNIKRQMLQQEIAFNIQQTDALTRLVFLGISHDIFSNISIVSIFNLWHLKQNSLMITLCIKNF